MIKAVLFDMDGVIINSEQVYIKFEIEIASSLGITLTSEFLSKYAGVYINVMWKDIVKMYNLSTDVALIIEQEENKMREYYTSGKLNIIKPCIELMGTLHNNKILCAIVTSSISDNAKNVISRLNISEYINTLVSGDMVDKCKPAPDIFLKCVEKLKINRNECVIIEDSKSGCIAANAADIKVIGYQNPYSGNQDLSTADLIVTDISDITMQTLKEL